MDSEEHQSTTAFRDYLRIKSMQPEPDYGKKMGNAADIIADLFIH